MKMTKLTRGGRRLLLFQAGAYPGSAALGGSAGSAGNAFFDGGS